MAIDSDVVLGVKLEFYYSSVVRTQSWMHKPGNTKGARVQECVCVCTCLIEEWRRGAVPSPSICEVRRVGAASQISPDAVEKSCGGTGCRAGDPPPASAKARPQEEERVRGSRSWLCEEGARRGCGVGTGSSHPSCEQGDPCRGGEETQLLAAERVRLGFWIRS